MSILDEYTHMAPNIQNSVDIFKGEWASRIPGGIESGGAHLFEDGRILAFEKQLGTFAGLSVLELGPLEGGHSYMMSQRGASEVLSIEANSRAYLKCLIVKNLFNLSNCQFVHGDFNKYLGQTDKKFDFLLACGVLYHMKNPVETIVKCMNSANSIGIWSHYFDEEVLNNDHPHRKNFSSDVCSIEYGGIKVPAYKHNYNDALNVDSFCGGSEEYSYWLPYNELISLFENNGFNTRIIEDNKEHPNGPCVTLFAEKK